MRAESSAPAAARMSAGRALLVGSAAIAIAIWAAAVVACGGTTSNAKRSWNALLTPISCGGPSSGPAHADLATVHGNATGARSQASRLSATRVIGPIADSKHAMRSGSSASGSRERGHHPPSRAPCRPSWSPIAAVAPAGRTVRLAERRWWDRCCLVACRRFRSRFRLEPLVGNVAGRVDAVRPLVPVPARGWGRAAGSVRQVPARRTSRLASGRRIGTDLWGR